MNEYMLDESGEWEISDADIETALKIEIYRTLEKKGFVTIGDNYWTFDNPEIYVTEEQDGTFNVYFDKTSELSHTCLELLEGLALFNV